MIDKKKTWWMLALVVVLATALPVLAFLQYQWIGAVSDGEQARMQRTLRAGMIRFVDDFNRPLEQAYEAFMPGSILSSEAIAPRLIYRYQQWQSNTRYPALLGAIYWIDYDTALAPQLHRLDTAAVALIPQAWPDTLASWKAFFTESALQPSGKGDTRQALGPPPPTEPPGLSLPALSLFQPEPGSPSLTNRQPGYLLLLLNQTYISQTIFPALAHTYFLDPEEAIYDVLILHRDEPTRIVYRSDSALTAADFSTPDVFTNLGLASRTDVMTYVTRDGAGTKMMVQRGDSVNTEVAVEITQTSETILYEHDEIENGVRAPSPRLLHTMPDQATKDMHLTKASAIQPWQLLVCHRAGSIEAAIGAMRRRTLGMGFGILLVLGGAAALLFISARRARRLAEQQMAFVAGVTHELRTPLAIIRSAAENLADGVITTPEQAQRYGALIHSEGRRLSEIVEQALSLAGAHSTHATLDLAPLAITPLVTQALTRCRPTLDEQTAEVTLDLANDLPLVEADAHALEAALCNLITNASKYGGPKPCIGLKVSHITTGEPPMVQIVVRDHGPGIPADELPHLFEPFFRGHAARQAQIRGSGLGLNLVKNTIEAHGGDVVAESMPGEGSIFTIYLPAVFKT